MLLGPRRRGDEAEILLQQHDDLIHIQAEIGDGVPLRQMVIGDELVPAQQLMGHKTFVVLHNDASLSMNVIYYITRCRS